MKFPMMGRPLATALVFAFAPAVAAANAVMDWNEVAIAASIAAKEAPTLSTRSMAAVHSAMYDAVNAIQPRYRPYKFSGTAPATASADAAAASAAHTVLVKLFPQQRDSLDQALAAAMAKIPEGAPRNDGVAVGAAAAQSILAWCADDRVNAPMAYRPVTAPGRYVATTLPVSMDIGLSRPWLLTKADQFRPPPPPALTSDTWTRDYNEIRRMGARTGSARSEEQTQVGQFWAVTGAPSYNPVIRQAVIQRKLGLAESARVTALAYMAAMDSLVAVFDAKYTYQFWRPITAVRNGDQHGNPAVARDAGWLPLVDAPLHPEYPCAHCISSSAVGNVLQIELGDDVGPMTMTSPTAPGVTRRWNRVSEYVQEVSNARVWSGVHYRFSTLVGQQMGKDIAGYATKNFLQPL